MAGSKLFEGSTTNTAHDNVTTILWLVIAVAVVAVATKFIRLPYTVVLVIAGVIIALIPGVPQITLTPELILTVFLPVLLFEASYHLSFVHLRENLRFVSRLATLGVVATAGIIASLLVWWGGLSWQTAFLFGAIVAATDPVSVVVTFRQLGAPHRLTNVIESESLFNDGCSLVLFGLILTSFLDQRFDFWSGLGEFAWASVGGIALGAGVGYLALLLLSRFDDYLTEILITLIVAYGTFLVAEEIHVSGALAVVAAGLLVGNFEQRKAFSATSQVALGYTWEFFGFLANSLIFLLVGLQVRTINFAAFWSITLLAIGITVLSRIVVVAFFSSLNNFFKSDAAVPFSWQLMLVWGGLRGALSLAMALSLPLVLATGAFFPDRDKILVMTFGVIMFTLLVQGLTIEPLLKWLKKKVPAEFPSDEKLEQDKTTENNSAPNLV